MKLQFEPSQIILLLTLIIPPTLAYIYTKRQSIESERRKIKQEYYRAYIESLSLVTDGDVNHENKVKHAQCSNDLYAVANSKVLLAMQGYQDAQTQKVPIAELMSRATQLVKEMRRDLCIKDNRGWELKLWTAGRKRK